MFKIKNKEKILKEIEKDKSLINYLERIKESIDELENNPFSPLLDIKKLKGYDNKYRVRIGDCRIVYEIDKNSKEIKILDVNRRGDINY